MAKQSELFALISEEQKEAAESQILEKQKETDFDIREYPIEVIVSKFTEKLEDSDKSELFVPDYQRELVWSDDQQSRFIESIFLNLPIPYLYVADVSEGEDEGRIEIVDGSQRIRTLVRFLNNEFRLDKLKLLPSLNGFSFKDFTTPRQLRFKRKTMRMIELIEVDEEGTEAAAVTAVMLNESLPPPPFVFRADRPFVFAIQKRGIGLLFVGCVKCPE